MVPGAAGASGLGASTLASCSTSGIGSYHLESVAIPFETSGMMNASGLSSGLGGTGTRQRAWVAGRGRNGRACVRAAVRPENPPIGGDTYYL